MTDLPTYVSAGEELLMKPQLILLPGVGCNESFWAHQSQYLSDIADIKVLVLDKQSNRQQMVDFILSEAREKFSLAGHSLGAWAAQALAAQVPDRVDKLFLMGGWQKGLPEFWQATRNWVERIKAGEWNIILEKEIIPLVFPAQRLSDTALIQRYQSMKKSYSKEIYVCQLKALLDDPDSTNLLPKIIAKTLLICGRYDGAFIQEQENMLSSLKNGKLTIIEECGHMAAMEYPCAVTSLMRLWLT